MAFVTMRPRQEIGVVSMGMSVMFVEVGSGVGWGMR